MRHLSSSSCRVLSAVCIECGWKPQRRPLGWWVVKVRSTEAARAHTSEGRLLTLCLLSSSVVILGFRLHWGSSVQQDVSCLLLMHCCKVFDVHYRLKTRSALCILHQCHSVSSSMVLNIASISNFWKMYGFPVFLFFSFSQYVLTKKKKGIKRNI